MDIRIKRHAALRRVRGVGVHCNIRDGRRIADQEPPFDQIAIKDVAELPANRLRTLKIESGAEQDREPGHRGP